MTNHRNDRARRFGVALALGASTVLPPVPGGSPIVAEAGAVLKDMDGSESLPKVIEIDLGQILLGGDPQLPAPVPLVTRVALRDLPEHASALRVTVYGQAGGLHALILDLGGATLVLQAGRLDAGGQAVLEVPLAPHIVKLLPGDASLVVLLRG